MILLHHIRLRKLQIALTKNNSGVVVDLLSRVVGSSIVTSS